MVGGFGSGFAGGDGGVDFSNRTGVLVATMLSVRAILAVLTVLILIIRWQSDGCDPLVLPV
jgi:hypothetical protein